MFIMFNIWCCRQRNNQIGYWNSRSWSFPCSIRGFIFIYFLKWKILVLYNIKFMIKIFIRFIITSSFVNIFCYIIVNFFLFWIGFRWELMLNLFLIYVLRILFYHLLIKFLIFLIIFWPISSYFLSKYFFFGFIFLIVINIWLCQSVSWKIYGRGLGQNFIVMY